jgi:hypothetical protein
MGLKEEIANYLKIGELRENIAKYVEAKFALVVYDFEDRIENVFIKLLYLVIKIVLLSMFFVFLGITFAIYLNNQLSSSYIGYVVVAGFFLILFLGVLFLKNSILRGLKKYAKNINASTHELTKKP